MVRCFFRHVSSKINKRYLRLCYLRVPFEQFASPPGFHVNTHAEGEPFIYASTPPTQRYPFCRTYDILPFCNLGYAAVYSRSTLSKAENRLPTKILTARICHSCSSAHACYDIYNRYVRSFPSQQVITELVVCCLYSYERCIMHL